jgi:hypothetical protein
MDKDVAKRWENWDFVNDSNFGKWTPKYTIFSVDSSAMYRMSNTRHPTLPGIRDFFLPKTEAMWIASNMMSNSLLNVSFKNAKMFFTFQFATKPWPYDKRKALASVLDSLTRRKEEDLCSWLTKTHPSVRESEWHYPTLGPQQPVAIGAVHVRSAKLQWHSVLHCSITMSDSITDSALIIKITTSW